MVTSIDPSAHERRAVSATTSEILFTQTLANPWVRASSQICRISARVASARNSVWSIIAANRAFVAAVQTRARELKAQGRSADEAATTIQQELQTAHPGWPRANGILALARSAFAEAP